MYIKYFVVKFLTAIGFLKNRQKSFNFVNFQNSLKSVNSVLIKPLGSAIGDAVIHTAHLAQLKAIYPNAKIGVLSKNSAKIIFEKSNLCDEIINPDKFSVLLQNKNKWELFLDFSNTFTSRLLVSTYILNPKIVVNFYKYYKQSYNLSNVKDYDFYAI